MAAPAEVAPTLLKHTLDDELVSPLQKHASLMVIAPALAPVAILWHVEVRSNSDLQRSRDTNAHATPKHTTSSSRSRTRSKRASRGCTGSAMPKSYSGKRASENRPNSTFGQATQSIQQASEGSDSALRSNELFIARIEKTNHRTRINDSNSITIEKFPRRG